MDRRGEAKNERLPHYSLITFFPALLTHDLYMREKTNLPARLISHSSSSRDVEDFKFSYY